jgi:hypothetical protein
MESLLSCGRSLILAGSSGRAAAYFVFEQSDIECVAAFDDDDTVSLGNSNGGDCFDAFLDIVRVISIEDTAIEEERDVVAIVDRRANDSLESAAAPPHAVSSSASEGFAVPPALTRHDSNIFASEALPEYSRLNHNNFGKSYRQQRLKIGRTLE